MNFLKRLFGGAICLTTAFFIVVIVVGLVTDPQPALESGIIMAMAVFLGGTFVAGARLYRSGLGAGSSPAVAVAPVNPEVTTLQLAKSAGGTLGPSQLAAATAMGFQQAKSVLESLRQQGACELIVSAGGAELYRFPDLVLTAEQTAKAKDLLES